MKTKTKTQMMATVVKYNAIYDERICGSDGDCIMVEAPTGMVWACDDVHELIGWLGYGGTIPRDEIYADLIERMEYGIERCSELDCEWCETK